jgi:hypothetical protein
VHAGLGGLHRVVLVVHGRCRAGEIVDLVDLRVERKGDVVAHQLEMLFADQVLDIALGPGEEIVDTDDIAARREQALAQMRAEKSGTAGDQDALFEMHDDRVSRCEPACKRHQNRDRKDEGGVSSRLERRP